MKHAALTELVCNSDSEQEDPAAEVEEPPGWRSRLVSFRQPIAQPFVPLSVQTAARRFYSEICAPYPNEPTRDRFKVVTNNLVGEGVIALADFAPGDIVFTFAGPILGHQTLFTLQIEPGRYIEDPLVMGKVLHSCDPNMICDIQTRTYWACKPIHANDYLFMDYESTEDELFREFSCCCGSEDCRGRIRGRRFLTPEKAALVHTLKDTAGAVAL